MKKINVKYCDFNTQLVNYGNWIQKILESRYDVELSDDPDFVFFGSWGLDHIKYQNAIKIFYSHEGLVPDYNDCDYSISMNDIQFDGRNLRLRAMPYIDYMFLDKSVQNHRNELIDADKFVNRRFCNFIYSANRADDLGHIARNGFCTELMKYKNVDCPGVVLNNMSDEELPPRFSKNEFTGKLEYLKKYKFTIAFEGTNEYSYTTERLMQALLANTIPIYWGNPSVYKDYNTKAFINCNDYNNDIDAVIDEVIRLDKDDDAYMDMLRQPPMAENYDFEFKKHLYEFIYNIIDNGVRFSKNHASWSTAGWYRYVLDNPMQLVPMTENAEIYGPIVIYGSGNYGNKAIHKLNAAGYSISGVCDSSSEKWDSYLMNYKIMSSSELKSMFSGKPMTLIIAIGNIKSVEKIFGMFEDEELWNIYCLKQSGSC